MQRLLASARALTSDGSSASMSNLLYEAEEDQAAKIRIVLVAKVTFKHRELCAIELNYLLKARAFLYRVLRPILPLIRIRLSKIQLN